MDKKKKTAKRILLSSALLGVSETPSEETIAWKQSYAAELLTGVMERLRKGSKEASGGKGTCGFFLTSLEVSTKQWIS